MMFKIHSLIIFSSRLVDKMHIALFVKRTSLNNKGEHGSLMGSGVCWTSALSAVQAVISFLHGLAFPSLWSGSAQHLLSPGWQLSHTADSPKIEEQHSFWELLAQSLFSHWPRDYCSSPVKCYVVLNFLGWQRMPSELISCVKTQSAFRSEMKWMKHGLRWVLKVYQWLTIALWRSPKR